MVANAMKMSKLCSEKIILEANTPSALKFIYMYFQRFYNMSFIHTAKAVDWFEIEYIA